MRTRTVVFGLLAVVSIGGVLAACTPSTTPISTFPALISAGDNHTCGQDSAGTLKCWGDNSAGELGTGNNSPSTTPVPVSGLSKVFDLSTAYNRTCVVTAYGGAVMCWGDDSVGNLGDGDNTFSNQNTPTQVVGLTSGWKSVRVGYAFSCALSTAGAVKCWGAVPNALGGFALTPVDVPTLDGGVGQITVGHDHACARLTSGAVECWGDNSNGEIGNNSTSPVYTPVQVIAANATDVAAGWRTTCAVVSTTDYCWGDNTWGQVGDGSTMDRWTPVPVANVVGSAFRASLSDQYSCVLANHPGVGAECWGKGDLGQLGDGLSSSRKDPEDVSGLTAGVIAFSAGTNAHGCAIVAAGAVCWGFNPNGEIGDGTKMTRPAPVSVSSF
jgi:alpha-tubulin suppressor-like RCC1 family protein